jgi:probable F420-dependent oxidoreductase
MEKLDHTLEKRGSVRYTLALPTDRVDNTEGFITARSIMEIASALEAAGVDACHVTDHPFPPAGFVAAGGHHSLDPLVTLSFAAAATTRLFLHTNVYIVAYRNPFIAAKGLSSLDALSEGRLILGIAAGYLEKEFAACGASFAHRGAALEEAVTAMRLAWSGEPLEHEGRGWRAEGNIMLPRPKGPLPIWVGGNSDVAMRRAVRIADGWAPFPASAGTASALRTQTLTSHSELGQRLDNMREEAASIGRRELPEVCVTPFGHPHHRNVFEPAALVDEAGYLAELGVTWLAIRLPAPDRSTFLSNIDRFGTEVVGQL